MYACKPVPVLHSMERSEIKDISISYRKKLTLSTPAAAVPDLLTARSNCLTSYPAIRKALLAIFSVQSTHVIPV